MCICSNVRWLVNNAVEYCLWCIVLERYREKLSDRRVEVILGNVAVIPCTAVSRSVPPAHTQFEFNDVRLRMTSTSRDLISLPVLSLYLDPSAAEYPPNSPKKTSLAENPPEKNAASRKSAE